MNRSSLTAHNGFALLCACLVALIVGAGCGGPTSSQSANGGANSQQQPQKRTTIDIKGFYADLHSGGLRLQRVNAEEAIFFTEENRFELSNVKVEFFDSEGFQVTEELFCEEGTWYTAPRPRFVDENGIETRPYRGKNDMDLEGNVIYRSVDGGRVMLTEKVFYSDETKKFTTNEASTQVRVDSKAATDEAGNPLLDDSGNEIVEKSLFFLKTERGFETDVSFTEWDYTNRAVNVQNIPFTQEQYDALVDSPPENAPDISDYEALK